MTERSWAPVSIEMPTPGVVLRGKRFARTAGLLARHLVPAALNIALRRQPKGVAVSRATRAACEELGATYAKFAQLVASAPAVVGPEVADEFRGTLDRGPSVSYRDVKP